MEGLEILVAVIVMAAANVRNVIAALVPPSRRTASVVLAPVSILDILMVILWRVIMHCYAIYFNELALVQLMGCFRTVLHDVLA